MTPTEIDTEALKKLWGDRIYNLRTRLEESRDVFGKRYGVTGSTVGRYENGEMCPKTEVFYQMLDTAMEHGALWKFTGATLPAIYRAMLKDPRLIPPPGQGVLAFLEIEVERPAHFIEVLNTIHPHALKFYRFGSPGEDSDGQAMAYVLFVIKDDSALQVLCGELASLEHVVDVRDTTLPPDPVTRRWK